MQVDEMQGEYKHDMVVLTMCYKPQEMSGDYSTTNLSEKISKKYEELSKNHDQKSCLLIIQTKAVDSAVIRAIFDLYKSVQTKDDGKSQLFIIGDDMIIHGLNVIGMLKLAGVHVVKSESEARQHLATI